MHIIESPIINQEVLDRQLNYWKQQLAGAAPLLELPTDRPRPAVQTYQDASQSFIFPVSLSDALKQLCHQEGTTLYTLLLTAFITLLYRYSKQEDIIIGSTIGERNQAAIRTDLSGNPSFPELLARVNSVTSAAYEHQDLPFEKLLEELQPERSLSYHPLFQVLFNLQNAVEESTSHTAIFDLTLSMEEKDGVISGTWNYSTDLFDDGTITRMMENFQTLLAGIVADPQQSILRLPLLTDDQTQQLLEQGNNIFSEYPEDKCIHQLFEAQVSKTPDKIAVVFENQELTYQQLNTKANQLAHYLQTLGVHPDTLVGIYVERSLEMVVGLLGILKAGGAYVPLDPAYPQERIALMLEDSQAPVIVTQSHLQAGLPETSAQVVCLDSDWQIISQQSSANLAVSSQPENLAYTIYTSGSTGKPKGVQIIQRAVVNFLTSMQHQPGITEDDVLLAVTTISFDIAVLELFLPITVGAKVVIVSRQTAADPIELMQVIAKSQATIMQATPATWRMLLTAGWEGKPDLKILCGGEAIPRSLANQLLARTAALWNMYGPTETTIWSTVNCITPGDGAIDIGHAIANTKIYIIDSNAYNYGSVELVPIGVPGELLIGGVGLARGYLHRPDLTAEKFIHDTFSKHPGDRLYRTGDLARYLADGRIELIGRIDYQVKIRGFRIELGEIETLLNQHHSIQQAVVVAREDVPGDKRLVAYAIAKSIVPTTSELRAFLKEHLPEYMVPSVFVFLDTMPLTPNGKVDRRALPAPEQSSINLDREFCPPGNPTEELLANIWSQVLGREKISINDNFFELGGHSLLATQIISRSRQAFSVEILLNTLLENPTIAALAAKITQEQTKGVNLGAYQAIPPRENPDVAPLSFAQEPLWLLDQLEPHNSIYNLPFAVRLQGELNLPVLQQALDAIAVHHEAVRTNFIAENGVPRQVINPPQPVELKIIDIQETGEAERESQIAQLLQQESQRPFYLESDLMLRGCLLKLAPQEHILLLAMHHIVSDGWSISLVWQQLGELYQAFLDNQPNPLPTLPIQYADYATWEKAWLTGEVLEQQLNYWKQQLAGANPLLELPTDRPRPAVQTYRGASQLLTIPSSLSEGLQQICRQEGVTLYMILLAAFQTLLYRYSKQTDIIVGSPFAGRNRLEVENLIGFFIKTLVIRTDLSGNPSFQELLKRVRSVTLDAFTHQDLPFEKLVEELHPERSLSYHSLFQVMFILQNVPVQAGELFGCTTTPVDIAEQKSLFDLTLSMEEIDGVLIGKWHYNTDLFDDATITRMMGHYQTLLSGIIADLQQPIAQLPLLTVAETQQLLGQGNDQGNYSQYQCIYELFAAQVERTPNAIAVEYAGEQLTYRELNNQANQLAHYLRSLGVEVNQLVGIALQRSLDMIVGIFAILKAGAAYLPLDPTYPAERLAYMVDDAQVSVIISHNQWRSQLPCEQAEVICLDLDWQEKIAECSQENPTPINTGEDLAYIIYTSGSTGKPKGVTITHNALSVFTQTAIAEYEITASDRVLQFASLNFDAAVEEIYPCLCAGGTLVLRSDEMLGDLPTFFQACKDLQLTVLDLPTAYWHQLAGELKNTDVSLPESLRLTIIGGEKVLAEPVRRWQQYVAQSPNSDRLKLVNTYGPTETTVTATVYTIPNSSEAIAGEVPIGRPLAHLQTYILDSYQQPVPIGIAGELYIGGETLAQGYLNRPELTAEKFIANPFSQQPQARLYRTGDLARYLPDGNIEFLGRIDNQVKIRGFRIELGEIEARLAQHHSIQETIVIAREDIPGDKRLVAYLVAKSSTLPTTSELRAFLKEHLPEYMVPSAFVFLDTLPLTLNRKVDHRALPIPDQSQLDADKIFVAPRDNLEAQLTKIWEEVLNIQPIGVTENFFELGGHSLLAVRMMAQIEKVCHQKLPLAAMFPTPTIEQLATTLRQKGQSSPWYSIVPVQPKGSRSPLFGIHSTRYHALANYLGTEQPIYALRYGLAVENGENMPNLPEKMEDLAAHYIQEMRIIQPQGPYYLMGLCIESIIAFEMAQQLTAQGEKVAMLALFDPTIEEGAKPLSWPNKLLNIVKIGPGEVIQRAKKNLVKKILTRNQKQAVNKAQVKYKDYVLKPYQGKASIFKPVDHISLSYDYEPDFGWGKLVKGGLDIYEIPGVHTDIFQEPNVQVVAEKLKDCLDKIQDKSQK
ncbi:amino acid adenylation domain-containing protein [Tolypothrix sp. FACHB-123]|uniref:non-ribosomal peptide synthetase n=1 Tax=Tolypothrix sp. FACHB-123 TaxID=2692868 RepID=UPI00168A3006|nr:non-ribosomal peptide synthetase [Tolypothrix sp. FACHB-123]MBD2355858.1 amino acid adenylation domain-containing protein [Tolypothrix sp. FACHB-123]